MAIVNFRSTVAANINDTDTLPINNGCFTYTTDGHELYLDYEGERNLIAADSSSGSSNYSISTSTDSDGTITLIFTATEEEES